MFVAWCRLFYFTQVVSAARENQFCRRYVVVIGTANDGICEYL